MNIQWTVMAKEMNDVIVLELAYSGMSQSYNCRETALRVYDNVSGKYPASDALNILRDVSCKENE